jgi:anti-sigma regulatory factor (Ser/Thr protein kinase)
MAISQVVGDFGISRTYAYLILHELQEEGVVFRVGSTNQTRYVLALDKTSVDNARKTIRHILLKLENDHLDEAEVFGRIDRKTGIFLEAPDNAVRLVRFGFTEMLNNAIDHSQSKRIEVDCRRTETAITFTVRDFGIGIFNNVRDKFRLPGTLAAVQEILKGKTTTAPKEHTGEGVFFTSKMADVFIIDSYEKRLTVNNLISDVFITDRKPLLGTRVSFSIHLASARNIKDVFDAYTGSEADGLKFDKTHITVKLFQFGSDLPSRSEAKRVTMNLENFRVIELDFAGVETVGQGFADEIFRVWQNRFPDIQLVPINANENVAFMIRRAGGSIGQEQIPL